MGWKNRLWRDILNWCILGVQTTMNQVFFRPRLLGCFLLLAASTVWAQAGGSREESIQQMLRIVLENNPALAAQQELTREAERLRPPRSRVALTSVNLSLASAVWDPYTGEYRLYPAATIGAGISIADPARALNSYNLTKARAEARQEQLKLKNDLTADLFSTVREILKLTGRLESLQKLKAYLQDYSDLIEKQVRAGVATPELDKLWDLKERLLGVEAEIGDVENQLSTMRLEASLRLAGDSWRELLDLFTNLGGK
jgi:outer membrane protein TolC